MVVFQCFSALKYLDNITLLSRVIFIICCPDFGWLNDYHDNRCDMRCYCCHYCQRTYMQITARIPKRKRIIFLRSRRLKQQLLCTDISRTMQSNGMAGKETFSWKSSQQLYHARVAAAVSWCRWNREKRDSPKTEISYLYFANNLWE